MIQRRRRRGGRAGPAVAALNDVLVGIREQLLDAGRLAALPAAVRASVRDLEAEVARLQAVTEWAQEGWISFEPERGRTAR